MRDALETCRDALLDMSEAVLSTKPQRWQEAIHNQSSLEKPLCARTKQGAMRCYAILVAWTGKWID
jgi:hypothetical protein